MKTFILSDLHLHPHQNASVILPSGRNSRLQHGVDAYRQVLDATEPGDAILFAGDWYDDQQSVPLEAIDASKEIIRLMIRKKVSVIIIPGNHDQLSRDGLVHSLGLLHRPEAGIVVVDKPKVTAHWAFLPFRRVPDLPDAIAQLNDAYTAVHGQSGQKIPLLCHVDLVGGISNSGHLSSKGLNLSDIPDWVSVAVSGHYHRHQIFRNFMFVGSPYQQTAGEMGEDKVYLVTDSESPQSVSDFNIVPFTGIPQFKEIPLPQWEDIPKAERDRLAERDFISVIVPHGAPRSKTLEGVRSKSLPKPVAISPDTRPVTKVAEGLERWLTTRGRGDLLEMGLGFLS